MVLLLTNDDGLGAPGLDALEIALGGEHDVWMVAPDREMSGQSHSITLSEGLKLHRYSDRRFSVRGTPVDCINLAFQGLLGSLPDLVISGINKGPNLGTDILYSGTCAAAREASLRGVPSLAASFASFTGPWLYQDTARFISDNLEMFLELWDTDRFINLNWPENPPFKPKVQITKPGQRRYRDEMVSYRSPRGGEYWFLHPAAIESSDSEGTDTRAVADGNISVTPVAIEPTLAPLSPVHDKMEWRGI